MRKVRDGLVHQLKKWIAQLELITVWGLISHSLHSETWAVICILHPAEQCRAYFSFQWGWNAINLSSLQ